jgi:hypothetical protein
VDAHTYALPDMSNTKLDDVRVFDFGSNGDHTVFASQVTNTTEKFHVASKHVLYDFKI